MKSSRKAPASAQRASGSDTTPLSDAAIVGMLDRADDGMVILDTDWRFVYANQRAAEILRQKGPGDLVGQPIWVAYPEGIGQPFQIAFERAMQTQRPEMFEAYFAPWDAWFENRLIPSPTGLMIFFSDITARKQDEQAAHEAQLALAQRSSERTDQLVEANRRLGHSLGETRMLYQALSREINIRALAEVNLRQAYNELEQHVAERTTQLAEANATLQAEIAERSEAERRLQRLNRLYATLSQINQTIVKIHARDELYQAICDIAIAHGRFHLAWIGLITPLQQVTPAAHSGVEHGYLADLSIALADGAEHRLVVDAILSGHSIVSNDIAADPRAMPWRERALQQGCRSMAAVPFHQGGHAIGVLNVYATEQGFFDAEQVQLLEEVSASISFALESFEHQAALRESEERFRSFIAQSAQGMALTDEQGLLIEWNPTMERLTEIPRDQAIGRTTWDLQYQMLTPDQRDLMPLDRLRDAALAALQHGQPEQTHPLVVVLCTPSGEQKIVEQTTFPIRTAKGYRMGGILQDVTARTRAQAELSRLLSILEQARELVASADTNGTLTYLNAQGRAMLGIPSDTPISQHNVMDFYLPEVADRVVEEIIPEAIQNGHWEGEMTLQRADGTTFASWQDIVVHYAPDGTVSQYSTIVSDITERRRAEIERQALLEIMQVLASTDDLHEALRLIHQAIGRVIYAENFYVVFHNQESGLFEEVYSVDQYDPPAPPSRLERSLTAYVFRTMRPLLVTKPGFAALIAKGAEIDLVGSDSEVWLGAPLTTTGRTVGVMAVQDYHTADRYSDRDLDFLSSIAAQVAVALQRKHDQDVLRFEEERFRELAENIQEGFWMYDQALQRTLYVSPAYAEILGRTQADASQSPYDVVRSIAPEDRELVLETVERQARGERTEMEYRVRGPDGRTRWIWDRSFPIFDQSGAVVRSIGIATDITDLTLARTQLEELNRTLERRVQESTAEVQDLFDNAPAGYHSLDSGGVFLKINQTELNWLGYRRDEIIGRMSARALLTPESQQTFDLNFRRLKSTGTLNDVELELIRKDGTLLTVVANATAIYDEQGEFLMSRSTIFDITARRHAEQALRQSQTSLQNFLDTASDLIQRLDQRGNYLYVNRAWCETLGYTASEASELNMFTVLDPAYHSHCLRLLNDLTTTGQPQHLEVVFRTKDGRAIIVEGSVSGDVGMQGQPITNGIFRDITTRKQAEEVLRQSRDELHAANTELARAGRLKDEFLSNMSHELRTPLNGILSLSESLEEGVYGALAPTQLAPVRGIVESGQHLLNVINDILDLSKIEAGKMELQVTSVNIETLSQGSMRLIRQSAIQKQLRVSYESDQLDANIQSDERRLKQILVNLLSNAVKFTHAGGQIGLRIVHEPSAEAVRFDVWDTGIGIASDKLPLLFQPFVQIDSSLTRQYNGTGLGLSLVRRLAELLGGSVGVESELGKGSRFYVTLPLHTVPARLQAGSGGGPGATASEPHGEGGVTNGDRAAPLILLVEDNLVNQESVNDYLTAKGFGVVVAESGGQALERAVADRPDLILMDIQMPQMDGLEATRRLRAMPEFAATPIIALTALAMPGDRERCLAAGATEYLTKPVSFKELSQIIRELLNMQ